MNILITNTVPLNGGDEALLRATIESLTARWPDCEITVLCSNVELSRRYLRDLPLASDLEFVANETEWQEVTELYQKADILLSTPGSIFHDYYPIEDRLRGLEVALDLGKPVVLFAQSVGPFWKPESLRRIHEVFNRVSCICVRDTLSTKHLLDCGVEASRIRETADAAFLWRHLAPDLFIPKDGAVRTIGLCFRAWPLGDDVLVKQTVAKAEQLCRHLLAETSRELLFVSTCQGIPGYVDDSVLALEIVARLPPELQPRCRIDQIRYRPRQLIEVLGQCHAFIGMRLHTCLLALLGGTPAMGVGYEHKTPEIFRQLGMEPYQISFEKGDEAWQQCAQRFLTDIPAIRAALAESVDRLAECAKVNLDVVADLAVSAEARAIWSAGRDQTSDIGTPEYFGKLAAQKNWLHKLQKAFEELAGLVPPDGSFILVDDNQFGTDEIRGRRAIPFLERDGHYWGPPSDDQPAIQELERLRQAGAGLVAFAWPSFWWLDHYPGMRQHLHSEYKCILENDRLVVFDLRSRVVTKNAAAKGESSENRACSLDSKGQIDDVIHRVRATNLTYLDYSALAQLRDVVTGLERRGVEGALIETGCALGGSALVITASKTQARPFYVYDVFGLIPAPSERDGADGNNRYEVIISGRSGGIGGRRYYGYEENLLEQVKATFSEYGFPLEQNNIQLIKGLYQDTLQVTGTVAFAHIDCDWYESVMTCLQRIEPHLVRGGILVIDDYHCWSGCRAAVDAYFADKQSRYAFVMESRLQIIRL